MLTVLPTRKLCLDLDLGSWSLCQWEPVDRAGMRVWGSNGNLGQECERGAEHGALMGPKADVSCCARRNLQPRAAGSRLHSHPPALRSPFPRPPHGLQHHHPTLGSRHPPRHGPAPHVFRAKEPGLGPETRTRLPGSTVSLGRGDLALNSPIVGWCALPCSAVGSKWHK